MDWLKLAREVMRRRPRADLASRRAFLRTAAVATTGLVVGDQALELWDRLTWRRQYWPGGIGPVVPAGGLEQRLWELMVAVERMSGRRPTRLVVGPDVARALGRLTFAGLPVSVDHGILSDRQFMLAGHETAERWEVEGMRTTGQSIALTGAARVPRWRT